MLFDTPLLDTAGSKKAAAASPAQDGSVANKRRRSSGGDEPNQPDTPAAPSVAPGAFDVSKLLKKMQQTGSGVREAKSPVTKPAQQQDGPASKRQKPADKVPVQPVKREETTKAAPQVPQTPAGEGKRAKKAKNKEKKAALLASTPSAGPAAAIAADEATPVASTSRVTTHEAPQGRHAAPSQTVVGSTSTASTKKGSVQDKLRAQLAGGKFRMLNEQLYTTSGDDAHRLMKEDGAFDDYHVGFRSQAATWPVHPLAIIAQSLLNELAPNSLIADFGCGDAALARTLCPPPATASTSVAAQLPPIPSLKVTAKAAKAKQLKVASFDLVSQSSYVVEAECSSVPLPGGTAGGEIVDAVVCCLSLMGTDWIRMIREARRVLRAGGSLKIAEVSSRFTSFDDFVKLVKELGFTLAHKDDSNTHFVLFDFVKQADGSENPNKVIEHDRKAATLLNPCIYKRR
ncbi:hypothetical protein BMF94_6522 [Rhodotorula taiwanensis]|uniref:Ribosomal RNA-processing protein 8 n=1 Tax=Rhodotorula taiwanensis TaxID=741276 RepID=A0A2S5B0Y5_9BASI|nr:hypothetical protein BMF94_6522 [Rhodotorula taiwanensis]